MVETLSFALICGQALTYHTEALFDCLAVASAQFLVLDLESALMHLLK